MIEKIVRTYFKKPSISDRDFVALENKIRMYSLDTSISKETLFKDTLPEIDKRFTQSHNNILMKPNNRYNNIYSP